MLTRQSPVRAPARRSAAGPRRPELRVVGEPGREGIRPARVGTIAGVMLFLALFGLAAFQTVLIRAQDRLDGLNDAVAEQEAIDRDLQLQLAELQSPERIAQVARDRLGMIAPQTMTFLEPSPDDDAAAAYAPPSTTPSTTAPKSTTTAPKASTTTTTAPKSSTTSTTTRRSTTTTSAPSSTATAQKSVGTGR